MTLKISHRDFDGQTVTEVGFDAKRRPHTCACGRPAPYTCNARVVGGCQAWLCPWCVTRVAAEQDRCPQHAETR